MASKDPQNCAVAQELATKGREIGRKSLKSKNVDSARYPQLLVFVSFSMPMLTLKALARDVNRVDGKLVLRGLVKGAFSEGSSSEGSFPTGSFPETLIKLQELQEEILIDPTLFEAYQVERVPTFVLRENTTESAEEKMTHDMLRGNVSLGFALEQFAEKGDVKEQAKQLLQNLRNKL
jgi:type-F conjugative transfer system pilin assembly protein TrbC